MNGWNPISAVVGVVCLVIVVALCVYVVQALL